MLSDYGAYLQSQTLADIETYTYVGQLHKELVVVKSTDSVEYVLLVMSENKINSVPVVDAKLKDGEVTKNGTPFLSIVNLVDLVTALAFQPVFDTYNTDTALGDLKETTLQKIMEAQLRVLASPVANYLGLSTESKTLWCLDEKDSLSKLLEVFSMQIRRILVSHKSELVNYWTFISQSDVLRYLKIHSFRIEKIHEVFLTKLSALKLGETPSDGLTTISERASALTGFRTMVQGNGLVALPVVNDEGQLVETLAVTDFRSVSLANFKDVLLPVISFLKLHRPGVYSSVVARSDDVLSSVVDKILLRGVHRVWVVDDGNKPIGAVSIINIIKLLSAYAPKEECEKEEFTKNRKSTAKKG